jgi:hypothetical protein
MVSLEEADNIIVGEGPEENGSQKAAQKTGRCGGGLCV